MTLPILLTWVLLGRRPGPAVTGSIPAHGQGALAVLVRFRRATAEQSLDTGALSLKELGTITGPGAADQQHRSRGWPADHCCGGSSTAPGLTSPKPSAHQLVAEAARIDKGTRGRHWRPPGESQIMGYHGHDHHGDGMRRQRKMIL